MEYVLRFPNAKICVPERTTRSMMFTLGAFSQKEVGDRETITQNKLDHRFFCNFQDPNSDTFRKLSSKLRQEQTGSSPTFHKLVSKVEARKGVLTGTEDLCRSYRKTSQNLTYFDVSCI